MTGSLQQLTSVYMCRHHEPEFEAIKEYISVLSEKLLTLERIGDRIYKERKGKTFAISVKYILFVYYFIPGVINL